ncbi:uncharacterized protein [Rutidosis leptorrhynchoides]|uniref:uncharacterized protein n=1 Tax=Rutidosis leptorrhynchoides TaxID=125765 RepID=UPI003A9A4AFE
MELKIYNSQLDNIDTQIINHLKAASKWEETAETRTLTNQEKNKWIEEKMLHIEKEKTKSNMLKQKSRIKWALEGDENSKYFHNLIKRRANKNNIRGVSKNGVWKEDPNTIKQEAYAYFNSIFKSKNLNDHCSFDNAPHLDYISQSNNLLLESQFNEKEIWDALMECESSKAPGPDGFNMKFFKKYWDLIKMDLINALNWFWTTFEISKGCNASFFTLIPKNPNPVGFNEYRPICLIGSYYKILTKILSNRLSKVIHKVIGYEQTTFLKGRNILDSVLIANEIIDDLKRKKKGLVFKVDFEKAFDCIEWDFLFNTMHCMGFGPKWISFIRACLASSSISVLINGSPTLEFIPERGIRQGDPISSFLFILVAEGLNILTKRALSYGHLHGLKIGRDNVCVTHLQYADDTIFFGEWNKRNAKHISKLLKCFEKISGRTIWKEIIKAGKIADSLGTGFTTSFTIKIGNGESTQFWNDPWCGSERFSTQFHRLYMLESYKNATVADRIAPFNNSNKGKWSWLRTPTGRTSNELTELNNLLTTVSLSDIPDSWKWSLDTSGAFTTYSLAKIINNLKFGIHASTISLPHNKLIPQKVGIFIWRSIQKRIPVRAELDKRGIDLDTVLCPLCNNHIETTEHILALCPKSTLIWTSVLKWWNQHPIANMNLDDAIIKNQSFTSNVIGNSIWQATKWITCYSIWKHRNLKVFSKKEWVPATIISEIQTQSFSWISKRAKKKSLEWQQWLINPSFYVSSLPHRVGIG